MSKIIKAWVFNPSSNPFAKRTDRAKRTSIACEAPESCSLLQECKSCILTGQQGFCRFGKKTTIEGPTPKARSFHAWLREQKAYCAEVDAAFTVSSRPLGTRILLINGWYYLPYPHMSQDHFGLKDAALRSMWMPKEELTAEVLERICRSRPKNLLGDIITTYQDKYVPKFLQDLETFHPDLFALLPQDQRERTAGLSFVGRKAALVTIAPGPVTIRKTKWHWDGTQLISSEAQDVALKGTWDTKVTPEADTPIDITRDDQVLPGTLLLD